MLKKIMALVSLFIAFTTQSKVLIWDFGGILFEPDKLGVANEIGLHRFVSYMLLDWQNPNIEKALFTILEGIPSNFQYPVADWKPAGSAEGTSLPPIMCEWQAGTKTGAEIIQLAHKRIEKLSKEGYFHSNREEALLKATIQTMFNPHVLARNVYPVPEAVKLLKDCAAVRNSNGTRKHQLIAFSNWDHLSFESFYKRNQKVFNIFDDIVISGHIHRIKPYKDAFQYLIDTLHLNPQDCILIDDQQVNADGAKACGMKALVINGKDYDDLRIKLIKYGILSQ
jgi:FMN phosphatase YigB (HAD superfamily)